MSNWNEIIKYLKPLYESGQEAVAFSNKMKITVTDFIIIGAIFFGQEGSELCSPKTINEIVNITSLKRTTISKSISKLQKHSYISIEIDKFDKRNRNIMVTTKTRKEIEKIWKQKT